MSNDTIMIDAVQTQCGWDLSIDDEYVGFFSTLSGVRLFLSTFPSEAMRETEMKVYPFSGAQTNVCEQSK